MRRQSERSCRARATGLPLQRNSRRGFHSGKVLSYLKPIKTTKTYTGKVLYYLKPIKTTESYTGKVLSYLKPIKTTNIYIGKVLHPFKIHAKQFKFRLVCFRPILSNLKQRSIFFRYLCC